MLNKVMLLGRLGKDPEIKTFENGGSIANFTVATNETYRDKDGNRKDVTDWHNISVSIPGLVKLVQQYFKKGDLIYLEGKNRTREYEKEGVKRYITEVQVDTVKFVPKSNVTEGGSNNFYSQEPVSSGNVSNQDFMTNDSTPFSDDLPF